MIVPDNLLLAWFPAHMGAERLFAIVWIFACWALYRPILSRTARGSLNTRLHVVREHWMSILYHSPRNNRMLDGVIMTQVTSATSFFGSATMLVLAAMIGLLANVEALHARVGAYEVLDTVSLELFTLYLVVITLILAITFFSFVYALRKLSYTLVMMGGLGSADTSTDATRADIMTRATAAVLTEAVKSLNMGIRGYYYTASALFLFVGPKTCILVTSLVTGLLLYRQLFSKTAAAIHSYVEAGATPQHKKKAGES